MTVMLNKNEEIRSHHEPIKQVPNGELMRDVFTSRGKLDKEKDRGK